MKRTVLLGVLTLATVGAMGCGDVAVNAPDWNWPTDTTGSVRVTSEWRGAIAPGDGIEIKGVYGAIRAVRTTGGEVVVTATRIGNAAAVAAVTIEAVPHAAGVTVCAVYPDVAGQEPNSCAPGSAGNLSAWDGGRGLVSVDFTVQVPEGVTLVGKVLTGDVEATGLGSDAFLTTMAGDILVSTAGLATATTLRGSIVAAIGAPDWGRDLQFSSGNGDVDVTIPATANAEVWATARVGRISSEFPLRQVLPGDQRGTIGSGGPTLRLNAFAGDITLRRGPEEAAIRVVGRVAAPGAHVGGE